MVTLAGYTADKRNPRRLETYSENNAIDTNVCQTRNEAIRLGRIAVDTLNRMPAELDTENWSGTRPADTFVSLTFVGSWTYLKAILITWRPDFDLSLLRLSSSENHSNKSPTHKGLYHNVFTIDKHMNGISVSPFMPICIDIKNSVKPLSRTVSLPKALVDKEKINNGGDFVVPTGFILRGGAPPVSPITNEIRACTTVIQYVQ